MKRIVLLIIIFWSYYTVLDAQMLGGNENGQSPAQEVKASGVNTGGVSGDVNLFTGTFNSSYPLGSVATPSGLSYGISLSYNSTFAAGDNLPQSTGIPYGEGWSLDVPTLSISTEDYNRYTLQQLDDMGYNDGDLYTCGTQGTGSANTETCPSGTPTPIFNNDGCTAAREEGRIFWFAPMLNIPGVASGRLVYKQKEGNEYVFVLHKFEQYVEARLTEGANNEKEHWTIITSDGTRFEMRAKTVSHRNATNQRVQTSCTDDTESLINLLLPKTEILTWHCERITHPNKTGEIVFNYQKLGAFNMFPIIDQYSDESYVNSEISRQFYDSGNSKRFLETAYQEILLTDINSGYEKLTLNYDNILKTEFQPELIDLGDRLLNPNDGSSTPKLNDPLYSYESIKTWNHSNDFNGWHRYLHLKSDFPVGEEYNMSATNPYQGTITPNPTGRPVELIREEINGSPTSVPFSHTLNNHYKTGYLESQRFGGVGSDIEMIAGDMYELKITLNSGERTEPHLLDINLATGDNSNSGNISGTAVPASCYNQSRGESVFSTLNQGFKWFNGGSGSSEYSNHFVMPNLPNQFEGFNIQIGPSNADNNNNFINNHPINEVTNPFTNTSYFNAQGAFAPGVYSTNACLESTPNSPIWESGQNTPNNIGIGMPWFMLQSFYEEEGLINYSGGQGFWYNEDVHNPFNWDNRPTAIKEGINLDLVELIRYAKNPYMLVSSQKHVKNKDGGWAVVNNVAFKYDVEKVRRYVNTKEEDPCNPTKYSYSTNTYRNIFVLTGIRQLTNGASDYESEPSGPTTKLIYEDCGLWDDGLNLGLTIPQPELVHNSNFVVLKKIIDPLGKETTLSYLPLGNNLIEEGYSITSGNSYSVLKTLVRQRLKRATHPPYTSQDCTNPPIKRTDAYAYQVHLVVRSKSVKNTSGDLVWNYSFSSPAQYNDQPVLNSQFSWDHLFNFKVGFRNAFVSGPSGPGGSPAVSYTHHTADKKLWGKLSQTSSTDASGGLTSRTVINYESLLAFDKPWDNGSILHPDFIETDQMFDVPYSYETRFDDEIESYYPDYLKSFFVKKTREQSWTYDASGNSISNINTYEYFDRPNSPGYAIMGISSLNQDPSFQLFRTRSWSPELGGYHSTSTTVENFYLYDLLNLSQYNTAMTLLGRVATKGMKNLPFEVRTTSACQGSPTIVKSSYPLYTTEVSNRIYLKQTAQQVQAGAGALVSFAGANMEPIFPFPTLVTSTIHSWNNFGQPILVENAKGAQTRNQYFNNGLLRYQYVGLGTDDQLLTLFHYFGNNKLAFTRDPNSLMTSYTYDGYGRLATVARNGDVIKSYAYSNWDGVTAGFLQRAEQNFVSTTTHVGPGATTSTAYVDPLGRNITNVNADVRLDYKIYDTWSRPILQLRPESYGGLANLTIGDEADHAEFEYETAPRSTVTASSKFGESISGDHIVESSLEIVNAGVLQSLLLEAGQNTFPIGGKFFQSSTTDEDGNIILSYTNAIGQKVATIANDNTSPEYDDKVATVFLYNSFGTVRKAINPLEHESVYKYNYLGQLFKKETVDAASSYYGYNAYGELIGEQDGNYNRVFAYDILGRMISQSSAGSLNDLLSNEGIAWAEHLDDLDAFDALHQAVIDASASSREKEWFYNTYDDSRWGDYPLNAQEYLSNSLDNTNGNLIQTVSYDLGGNEVEYKFFSYNEDNFIKWEMMVFSGDAAGQGLLTRVDYPEYNLQGSPLKKQIDLNGNHTLDFQYKMEYDSQNRLLNAYVSYDDPDNSSGFKIVSYAYDDVKGVVANKIYYASGEGECTDEQIDEFGYAYDARHRLTSISSNFYNETLYYDGDHDSNSLDGATDNYNGNINSTTSSYALGTAENAPENIFNGATIYNYDYDHLNRLIGANANVIMEEEAVPNLGDVEYAYDKVSNITMLNRWVLDDQDQPFQEMYNYNYAGGSNKLNSIDHQDGTRVFSYDGNGNLTTDTGKGIVGTGYGRANLPWTVTIDDTNDNAQFVRYLYDASDSRVFKNTAAGSEYYIRSADGQELAVFDMTNEQLTWYVHGNERVAKIIDQTDVEFSEEAANEPFNPCPPCDDVPHIPTPDRGECIDRYSEEAEAYFALQDRMGTTVITDDLCPTVLYRIRLCEDKDINVLRRELNDVDISFEIHQTIEIIAPDQVFNLERSSGELEVNVPLSEMLDMRRVDEPIKIDGFETPGRGNDDGRGPTDPADCDLEENPDPPIPAPGFYAYDHLGNTRVHYAPECDGDMITYTLNHVADYLPYGKILREYVPADPEKFLTTGHERDVETGLDYRGARFYDADVCRFLSLDPLAADFANVSAFNYVLGNPVSLVDPSGRAPEGSGLDTQRLGAYQTAESYTTNDEREITLDVYEHRYYKRRILPGDPRLLGTPWSKAHYVEGYKWVKIGTLNIRVKEDVGLDGHLELTQGVSDTDIGIAGFEKMMFTMRTPGDPVQVEGTDGVVRNDLFLEVYFEANEPFEISSSFTEAYSTSDMPINIGVEFSDGEATTNDNRVIKSRTFEYNYYSKEGALRNRPAPSSRNSNKTFYASSVSFNFKFVMSDSDLTNH